ncbi:MAG: hypothetical protein KIT87_12540 [Anaerolineae bacterium]|nr:hypothetical protein [Anaerolineae bacterium]
MPNVTVNGRRLDYTEYDLRVGPIPLILLAEDRDWWKSLARLIPWDYQLASLAWSGDADLTANDTIGFAKVMGMPWVHLVGYGVGARTAVLAALKSPKTVRSLTLIAPFAGAQSLDDALPWDRLSRLVTPTLVLEPEGSAPEAQQAVDRLLDLLPNSRPDLVRGWRDSLNDDLARRLAIAIVNQVETAYDGTTPLGVSTLRG